MSRANTKLAINQREGTVEVEGDETFVRFIYEDFKTSLNKHVVIRPVPAPPLEHEPERSLLGDEGKQRRKKPATAKAPPDGSSKTRSVPHKPTFNSKLDLTGLAEFYDNWNPENNAEKILVFAVFLRDCLGIAPCSADDVYTCFFTMKAKTKIPEAFMQAFINAKNRTHFIEFDSTDAIHITIAGDNRFNEQGKRAKELET